MIKNNTAKQFYTDLKTVRYNLISETIFDNIDTNLFANGSKFLSKNNRRREK
jgi:hypothetical protein